MKPEEKAKLLVERFKEHVDWNNENGIPEVEANAMHAKQCALIAVDEIIDIWKSQDGPPGSTYSNAGKYYWKQVKQCIENQ